MDYIELWRPSRRAKIIAKWLLSLYYYVTVGRQFHNSLLIYAKTDYFMHNYKVDEISETKIS